MKPCPNCRIVYSDDYAGTCTECGAPMGSVRTNQTDLSFAFARQVQRGTREAQQENAMKAGRYTGVEIEGGLMEVARAGAYLLERAAGKDVSGWEA